MGDPWFETNEKIDHQIEKLKLDADIMGDKLRDEIKQAKESALFEAIRKLELKVDALASRLPEPEDT